MKLRSIVTLFAALAFVAAVCEQAFAHPLPGQTLKFSQLPLNNAQPPGSTAGAPYPGHDEWSTARAALQPSFFDYTGTFMADDFADNYNTPVVHVKWWGSYENNINENLATKFLISFETDVPFDPQINSSRPGTPILSQVVTKGVITPGSGTFTETLVNPMVAEHLWEYNAELALPFNQQKDTVYWLKIVALNDPTIDGGPFNWGWHNRDWGVTNPLASPAVIPGEGIIGAVPDINGTPTPVWHFQDDAVQGLVGVNYSAANPAPTIQQSGYTPQTYIYSSSALPGVIGIDGPLGIQNFSKDLAFELYTIVPEPAAVLLFGIGTVGLGISIWKRRRRGLAS
jgi:hypothetical protein